MAIHADKNGRIHFDYETLDSHGDSTVIMILVGPKGMWPDKEYREKVLKRHGLRHIQLTFGTGQYDVVPDNWAESLVSMDMARYVE